MDDPHKIEITDLGREQIASNLMLEAAKIEFQAACYRNDRQRLDAARAKLTVTLEAWADACLASITDSIRRISR